MNKTFTKQNIFSGEKQKRNCPVALLKLQSASIVLIMEIEYINDLDGWTKYLTDQNTLLTLKNKQTTKQTNKNLPEVKLPKVKLPTEKLHKSETPQSKTPQSETPWKQNSPNVKLP